MDEATFRERRRKGLEYQREVMEREQCGAKTAPMGCDEVRLGCDLRSHTGCTGHHKTTLVISEDGADKTYEVMWREQAPLIEDGEMAPGCASKRAVWFALRCDDPRCGRCFGDAEHYNLDRCRCLDPRTQIPKVDQALKP